NEEKAETINNTSGTTDNNGINNEEEYKPEEIDMGEEFEFETSDSEFAITVNDAKLVAPEKSNQSPAMLVDMTVENIGDEERSEEHTSELQSRFDLVCRLLL